MKIYVSQPMKGRSEIEIESDRAKALVDLRKILGGDFEVIDSVNKDFVPENRLQCLGHSIALLNDADLAIFLKGWKYAKGCRIEMKVCQEYEIPTLVL